MAAVTTPTATDAGIIVSLFLARSSLLFEVVADACSSVVLFDVNRSSDKELVDTEATFGFDTSRWIPSALGVTKEQTPLPPKRRRKMCHLMFRYLFLQITGTGESHKNSP